MAVYRPTPSEWLGFTVVALAVFGYPIVAGAALAHWEPRAVAGVALGIALLTLVLRHRFEGGRRHGLLLQYGSVVALLLVAVVRNDAIALRLFPAFINAALALGFGLTLRDERSLVERGAAHMQPHLPDFARPYCRKVTAVLAIFFAGNAIGIAAVAFLSPEGWWAAYTSRIYPLGILALCLVEFFARKIFFRNYSRGWLDRVFSLVFPAENTAQGRRSAAYLDHMRALGIKTD